VRVVHRIPAAPLDQLVRLWACEAPALADGFERSLPVGTVALFVNLAEDELRWYDLDRRCHRSRGAVVASARAFPYLIDRRVQRDVIGASFVAGGAAPFFAQPIGALGGGAHVALEEVWGAPGARVRERVLAAATAEARLAVLEAILREQLVAPPELDAGIERAVRALAAGATVGAVRAARGASAARFIQTFTAHVGLTPKRYQRVARFDAAARALARPRRDLAAVAAACGYYDQSHLVREFRALAGTTPSAYAAGDALPTHARVA
jgi:AraC-like DNA-binding protein